MGGRTVSDENDETPAGSDIKPAKTDWKRIAARTAAGLLIGGWGVGYATAKTVYGIITTHDALVTYIPVLTGIIVILGAWKEPVSHLSHRVGGALKRLLLRSLRTVGRLTLQFWETLFRKHRRD